MPSFKVLLVEDDEGYWTEVLLEDIHEAIQAAGHKAEIHHESSFLQARGALRRGKWDLVVTDIDLGRDHSTNDKMGMQLVDRANSLEIPCIVVSGAVDPYDVGELLQSYHAYAFFWKPIYVEAKFRAKIQEALGISSANLTGDQRRDFKIPLDPEELRAWWQKISENDTGYICYAFLLLLPGDEEVIRYVTDLGPEMDLIASNRWLIIALGEKELRRPGVPHDWTSLVTDYVYDGFSMRVGRLLEMGPDQFPCLVLFEDLLSDEHIIISLQGLNFEEIAQVMRSIAAEIHRAASKDENSLREIRRYLRKEAGLKAGRTFAGAIRSLAGKTYEVVVKSLIDDFSKTLGP